MVDEVKSLFKVRENHPHRRPVTVGSTVPSISHWQGLLLYLNRGNSAKLPRVDLSGSICKGSKIVLDFHGPVVVDSKRVVLAEYE